MKINPKGILMLNFIIASAHAQEAAAPQQNPIMSFVPIILVFLVLYFLMIRPQKKKMEQEQKLISELQKGDEVYTKLVVNVRLKPKPRRRQPS